MQNPNRSWIALVTFCTTAAIVTALGLAILFATATAAFGGAQSSAPSGNDTEGTTPARTFAGLITDANCGARHSKNSGKSPAECVQACVRNGSKYTLVDGDKVHILDGKTAEIDSLAGQRVKIVGTLDGETIKVSSVAAQ